MIEDFGLCRLRPNIKQLRFVLLLAVLFPIIQESVSFGSSGVVLPNSFATPGAINPAVSQRNIHSTICTPGYTKTIRPPVAYTNNLKIKQLSTRPYSSFQDSNASNFEEDHLIPLELGGSAVDPKNLWPEPYAGRYGAKLKDKLENRLHLLVCEGTLSLQAAQRAISSDWYNAYLEYELRKVD